METVFTGIWDFQKLVLSVTKLHFSKAKVKEISHRNCKYFKENNSNRDFRNRLLEETIEEYAPFEKIFLGVLSKHAPLKRKVACANNAPYIIKVLKKAIMKRFYLEKVHFKKRTPDSLIKLKK